MAMTLKEFVEKTGAEIVGGRLIVGERSDRRFVGSVEEGVFNLNAEGQELQAALEAGMDAVESQEVTMDGDKPKRGPGRPAKE